MKIILFIPILISSLYAGLFDNTGSGSDSDCDSIRVEYIDGATDNAYNKYSYSEHCRDFKFQTNEDGYISLDFNASDDSNLTVGDSTVENKQDYLFFKVDKDTEYTANFKRVDSGDTDYTIRFDFIKTVKEEESDSICGGETEESGASVGCNEVNGDLIIPIINSGDRNISDIRVFYKNDKVMIGILDCELKPGTDEDPDHNESCVVNGDQRAFFDFREHTIKPDQHYDYNDEDRNETYIRIKKNTAGDLSCKDADIEIIYTSEGKTYKGALEECIEPEFCYDYAYEQNGRFFTEDNNGSEEPNIVGKISKDSDITVKFYITNNPEADPKPNMYAKDLKIYIYDINTSQADYKDESTYVIYPNTIIEKHIKDENITINEDDGIKSLEEIQIGTVKSDDRFYAKYNLSDINTSDINMSLDIKIVYSTGLGDHEKRVGANEIHLCPTRGYSYYPTPGVFNIVDSNLYSDGFYNLQTQVSSRVPDLTVISTDENDTDELKDRFTIVSVELIDVSAFHYTEATCQEESSKINDKIFMIFENTSQLKFSKNEIKQAIDEGRTTISKESEFYKSIKRNTAFRVNVALTKDGDLIELEKDSDKYKITNIPDLESNDNKCGTFDSKVKDNCKSSMTISELTQCSRCLYGGVKISDSESTGSKFICSRDNFTIRPESFKIQIDEYENNSSDKIELLTGHKYKLDVNATNHINNSASFGYTKQFGTTEITSIWNPEKSVDCNDEDNKTILDTFIQGEILGEYFNQQVGDYNLSFSDNIWSSPDSNKTYMKHHYNDDGSVKDHFKDQTDCKVDNSEVPKESSNDQVGCNISSNHSNQDNNESYFDMNITFYPFKITADYIIPDNWFYYSNTRESNLELDGNLTAKGEFNISNSNFTDGCFADNISVSVTHSFDRNITIDFMNSDSNISSENNITLNKELFHKENNGTIESKFFIRYNREYDNPYNPIKDSIKGLTVTQNDENKTKNIIKIEQDFIWYFGRTKVRNTYTKEDELKVPVDYEIYCYRIDSLNQECDKSLLPSTKQTNDLRFFLNTDHNKGKAENVLDKLHKVSVDEQPTGSSDDFTKVSYSGERPYIAPMKYSVPGFLFYDKYGSESNISSFTIKFEKTMDNWAQQVDESNASTKIKERGVRNFNTLW